MVKIDTSLATVNPLREHNAPAFSIEAHKRSKTDTPRWSHALRAVFFVLIPQFVWLFEYAFVENHFVLLVYMQIVYVVVLQSVLVETFVEQPEKKTRRRQRRRNQQRTRVRWILCLMALLYVGASIGFRTPQASTGTAAEGSGKCECGDCEPFSTEDISKDFYPSYFSSGDSVMGIGVELNETRLSWDGIVTGVKTVEQYMPVFLNFASNADLSIPDGCVPMFTNALASSFFRPCEQSCLASNLSASSCLGFMKDCDPSFLQTVDFDDVWDHIYPLISSINALGNDAETALLFGLFEQGVKTLGLLPHDKSSFCASPLLFTNDYNVFSCSDDGALKKTRSFSHTAAKASWALLPVVMWALLARFKPRYRTEKGTYSTADMLQLILCFLFLTTLAGVLVHKLSTFGESAGHGLGIVLLGVSYMWCGAVFALLKGKSAREINTKETNPIVKYYSTFKILTDVNDGPYFFAYSFVVEVLEIIVQSFSFDAMVRTNDLSYVRWSVTIISLNLVLTPMSYVASRFGRQGGRKLTFVLDTLLESAYLFLNLIVVREQDLAQFSIVLSIAFPLLTLRAKVNRFVEAITTFVENKERRDSWVQKSFHISLPETTLAKTKRRWTRKQNLSIGLAVMLTSGLGGFVFVYMMSSAYRIDSQCGEIVGVDVWESARPRHVFADGPLFPKCNFASIKEVRARQKGIKELRKEVGLLTSVVHFDVSENSIERLPVEIAELAALVHVNMAGNPVWKALDWHGQQLDTFPGILRFFTKLERLNLGHNRIENVPESIGRLQRLSELTLQNNSISALPQQVTQLIVLKSFDVQHNPVATSLSWHGVDPAGAVRIFRLMGGLIDLDISKGRFESVGEVLLALPRLQRLNASNNLLKTVVSTNGNHIRELDVSNNPGIFSIVWEYGELESIKLNGLFGLQSLGLRDNELRSIPLIGLTALTLLSLGENRLQSINLNGSIALADLRLHHNCLRAIGVNHLTALTYLNLNENQLRSLDLSGLTALSWLSLENNTLQSINLTGLTALTYVNLLGKSIKNITGWNRTKTYMKKETSS